MSDCSEDMEIGSSLFEHATQEQQEKIDGYAKKKLWRTKRGDLIPFSKIDENHKRNIIKWCESNYLIPPPFEN